MNEQQLADDLQHNHNIEKIRMAVEKVSRQREAESSNPIDFEHLGYTGDSDLINLI